MGLFRLIANLFRRGVSDDAQPQSIQAATPHTEQSVSSPAEPVVKRSRRTNLEGNGLRRMIRPLRYKSSLITTPSNVEVVESPTPPYDYARFGNYPNTFLDLSRDADADWLKEFDLPKLTTPEELADWLDLPLGQVAWLAGRFESGNRPDSVAKWHYTPQWIAKKSGGYRLLEIPKPGLKMVQTKILREILDKIPAHRAAHGFVSKRSAITNADVHAGAGVLFQLDLENFYTTVLFSRVVAIFRTVGFSRDVAIWLARLTTSSVPYALQPPADASNMPTDLYRPRHLPQGAPTSPALANLSAYSLDVRLAGLAKSYKAVYTRYADDITFSGAGRFIPALRQFIPLAETIVRDERFKINKRKRKVLRRHQRMTVTGVVVNKHVNVSRRDYDRLKAIVHNCVKSGPESQNRDQHPDFAAHLRGRIEYVRQLNPARGEKLMAEFAKIRWTG